MHSFDRCCRFALSTTAAKRSPHTPGTHRTAVPYCTQPVPPLRSTPFFIRLSTSQAVAFSILLCTPQRFGKVARDMAKTAADIAPQLTEHHCWPGAVAARAPLPRGQETTRFRPTRTTTYSCKHQIPPRPVNPRKSTRPPQSIRQLDNWPRLSRRRRLITRITR